MYDQITVLIVDDSTFARHVAARALRTVGVTSILEAVGGQAAIALLAQRQQVVDVVFCDLLMPDMDGVQMIRSIANLPAPPAIVFLSGVYAKLLNIAQDTARARGLRVLGGVPKPLTPDSIRRVLARLGENWASGDHRSDFDLTPWDLDEALAAKQFLLYFQPKVALSDGHIVGVEALVRWQHPQKGLIPPDAFIALAEQSGRMGSLTDMTTSLAMQQCAAWALAGVFLKVSVNLSAYALVDLDLPDRLEQEANLLGINPRQLILEITESGLFEDTANTLDILARLHMKGFALSIDDFGTGYSSLKQLRRFPFTEMKIDRAFVSGAAESPKARVILKAGASLGRRLKMSVVAEGIETQQDWNTAIAAGVDVAQGYLVAKPMAGEQIPDWMRSWTARQITGDAPRSPEKKRKTENAHS